MLGRQNCELGFDVVIGGKGPQAMPVVLVMPKAAALARTSVKSANVSTGMTFTPADCSPVKSVVL